MGNMGGIMKKTIKIGTKEFQMSSSAYTQFKYKDITGKSFIKDLTDLAKKYESMKKDATQEEAIEKFDDLDEFITTALRVAYIMSCEGKSFNGSFDEYLMNIDNYLENTDWISEVVDLAISPLSRNIQANKE